MHSDSVLPSIFELDGEDGGRIARTGFNYQDHISASFCIDMLLNENLQEIWFEYRDDITLIWKFGDNILVEFVQVKSENRQARWSISSLTERSNGAGSSLFERSLQNACCLERTQFRIVTSIGVNLELDVLTLFLDNTERLNRIEEIHNISRSIISRLGNFSSLNCTTINDWVKKCYWDKRSDSETDIAAGNILRLDRVISQNIHPIAPDHRDEIYQKLLAKVKEASSGDRSENPAIYKITKSELIAWLIDRVSNIMSIEPDAKKLIEKMSSAKIDPGVITNAKELRMKYIYDRYKQSGDYINLSRYNDIDTDVTTILQLSLSGLDSGRIDENGVQFHDRCLQELHLMKIQNSQLSDIPERYLLGCMYFRTNRCVHRFLRASP